MNDPRRIMVIGCCGAGKSTLSKRLAAATDLPLIHLDQHYWKHGWVESEPVEWQTKVRELSASDHWIIDGNYGGTMDLRIERADMIIYLDYPTWKCMYRVLSRTVVYLGQSRPDLVEGCPERFDLNFLHYVLVFNLTRRKSIMHKVIAAESDRRRIHVLTSDKAADALVKEMKMNQSQSKLYN